MVGDGYCTDSDDKRLSHCGGDSMNDFECVHLCDIDENCAGYEYAEYDKSCNLIYPGGQDMDCWGNFTWKNHEGIDIETAQKNNAGHHCYKKLFAINVSGIVTLF